MSFYVLAGWSTGLMFASATLAAIATGFKQIGSVPYVLSVIFLCIYVLWQKAVRKSFDYQCRSFVGSKRCLCVYCWIFLDTWKFAGFSALESLDNFSYIGDTRSQQENSRPIFSPLFIAIGSAIYWLSDHIRANTDPEDRIVVWGLASQIYVISERGSGTRFIPADYVSGRMGGMHSSAKHPFFERNMSFYLADFEKKKPQPFIDTASASLNDYQFFPIKDYPDLNSYLQANYNFEGEFEGFGIWRRKKSSD